MECRLLSKLVKILAITALIPLGLEAAEPTPVAVAKPVVAPTGGVNAVSPTSAVLVIPTEKGKVIAGLGWPIPNPPLNIQKRDEQFTVSVDVRGKFERPDWSLLWNAKQIKLGPKGDFRLKLSLVKDSTPLKLMAIGPLGEIETTEILVTIPRWNALRKGEVKGIPRHFFSMGVGPSLISFNQNGTKLPFYDFSETVITGKASYSYALVPGRWDVGLSGFMTMMVLSSTDTHEPKETAKFIAGNVRIGYIFPMVREPFRVMLMTGAYFTTMPTAVGFSNLMGPQLFPVVRRIFKNGDSGAAYFKFSPVGEGIGIVNLGNREIASGLSYNHVLKNGHPLIFSFDWAHIGVELTNDFGDLVPISATSFSLGIGYGW